MPRPALLAAALLLTACDLLAPDPVVPVDPSETAAALAQASIHQARPLASRQVLDRLVGSSADIAALEATLLEPLSLSAPPDHCPYLTPSGPGSTLPCRQVSDSALTVVSLGAPALAEGVVDDVTTGRALTEGERGFVSAWSRQAVDSGHHSAAIVAVDLLRTLRVCDDAPDQAERAFVVGEAQGRTLLEETAEDILPHIPAGQCNTDIVAATVLAEARRRAFDRGETASLCEGVASDRLAEPVDLAALDPARLDGVEAGLDKAHEVLRVQLAHSWKCDPSEIENLEPCHCFARYSGNGPVYCFYESQFESFPPTWGGELEQMASAGEPQCYGEGNGTTPIGSPLVLDLDGQGIHLSPRETVPFDLAGDGEPVRIAALTGGDAFLALDLDGDGVIDSGLELFGDHTRCGERRCADGLEALAQHDANGDGVLDAADPVFHRLVLWQDTNGDGRSQPDELQGLASAGIERIDLTPRMDLAWVDARGNSATRALDVHFTDGRVRAAHDVWFALTPLDSPLAQAGGTLQSGSMP